MDIDIAMLCSLGVLGISSHKPADQHIERIDFGKILYYLILTCFKPFFFLKKKQIPLTFGFKKSELLTRS